MAKIIKNNISYTSIPSSASMLPYDNADSGLEATNVKDAIDELAESEGSSTFAGLSDVSLSDLQNGQVPKYNSQTQKWENANESGGGSTVTVTQIQSTGTKIATIGVDSVNTDLYSPVGVSSVAVTQVQSTGTKIGTINVDGTSTDLYAPNGGSGGHTIVNEDGTSLTQRTNLQFNGSYLEDNSVDDTTEVNVAREMTKAEFDLLSDDEKVGFINVTDITPAPYDKFQPVIYSEDEREIGVWTNGKPLYQKTLKFVNDVDFTNGKTFDTGVSNMDFGFVKSAIFYDYGQNRYESVPFWQSISSSNATSYMQLGIATDTWKIVLRTTASAWSANANRYLMVTIQYTKSTDTAGSGTWTPQGVPAHHYSTDEQIVGTWIDGSTVYERVIDLGSNTSIDYQSWTLTSISLSSVSRLISISALDYDGNAFYGDLLGGNNNGYLQLLTPRNGNIVTIRYIIFRYTKSSS